jgi:hypothetical protein
LPSKRSPLTNAAAVLLLLVAATSGLTADNQKIAKHARVEYFKDQSTPDGIVYHSFLSNLIYFSTFSRADAVHRIVDLFKLSHDETGTAIASSLYDRFEASYYDLTDEITAMEARVLCPPGRKARTKARSCLS